MDHCILTHFFPSLHVGVDGNLASSEMHGPDSPDLSRVVPCVIRGRRGEADVSRLLAAADIRRVGRRLGQPKFRFVEIREDLHIHTPVDGDIFHEVVGKHHILTV